MHARGGTEPVAGCLQAEVPDSQVHWGCSFPGGKGMMPGSSTLLTVVCEGGCPPVIKCATGSRGWKGSVLQMPAA